MPNNKPGSRLIKAAGGVAWRPGPCGEPEILLVHRKKYDDWSLPKGKTEPGEPLPLAAVREVLEEGGASLALGRRLASVRYNVGGRPKRVHYWAARVLSVDGRAVPNPEVDEVTWLPAARAVDKVSYPHDLGVLADFTSRPAQTVPLILLRHSEAVQKNGWKRSDTVRPLHDSGRSDAKALAGLLACFAPRPRLISSSAVRCADTLRPLSQLTGEQVRIEPSLYIHSQASRTSAAGPGTDITALVREAIASGEPTVICAHRENIPVLVEAACAALTGHSADVSGAGALADAVTELPKEWDGALPTSGFWVLNVAPLPPAQEAGPEQAAQDPAALDPAALDPAALDPAASAPAAGRRWWQWLRVRAGSAMGTRPAADATPGDVVGGDVVGGGATRGGATRGGVVGGDATPGDVVGGGVVGGGATRGGATRGGATRGGATSGDATRGGATSGGGEGGGTDDCGVTGAQAGAGGAAGASIVGPLGVLISADRYDLADS